MLLSTQHCISSFPGNGTSGGLCPETIKPQPHSVCPHRQLICVLLSPVPLDCHYWVCSFFFFLSLFSSLHFHSRFDRGKDRKGESSSPSTYLYSLLHQASKLLHELLQHWSSYPYVLKINYPQFSPLKCPKIVFHTSPDLVSLPQTGISVLWIPTHGRSLSFDPLIQLMYLYTLFIGTWTLIFSVIYFFQTSLFSSLQ